MRPILKVLLVDDDEDEGVILKEALSFIDIKTILQQINSFEEVAVLPSKFLPDIAFVDINMPRVDGFECVKTFRSHGYTFPIVMYSTSGSHQDLEAALHAGADFYYTKQGNFNTLVKAIREFLDPVQGQN